MRQLVLLLLAIFMCLILYSETAFSTDFESLRQTAEMYRDYVIKKAREAREARKKWMVHPNIENQNNYNFLVSDKIGHVYAIKLTNGKYAPLEIVKLTDIGGIIFKRLF